jgi:BirA family biotin operon repressor/biotin-[acetyl-CoA-carboxylase] ligase
MKLIKLDAIDSTNTYLKDLSRNSTVENFTVVHAKTQTNGKGQMGSIWSSEGFKNLTMSILIKNESFNNTNIFDLNIIVACSINQILQEIQLPNLSIKWPNDMMSDNKKIGGILIENLFSGNEIICIVGIGLNVNQVYFEDLPNASSIKNLLDKEFIIEELLLLIVEKIKFNYKIYIKESSKFFWEYYNIHLFKKNIPMVFEDQSGHRFMGIIKGVDINGKINIQLEDDSILKAGLKDIKMLY